MAEILKSQQSYINISKFLKAYNQICENPTGFINPKTGVVFADKNEFIELAKDEAWLKDTLSHKNNFKTLGYNKSELVGGGYFNDVIEDIKTLDAINSKDDNSKEKSVTEMADYLTSHRDVLIANFQDYKDYQHTRINQLETDTDTKIKNSEAAVKSAKKEVRKERRKVFGGVFGRLLLGLTAVVAAPAIVFSAVAMTGGFGALFTMPAFGITLTAAAAVYASYKLLAKPFKAAMAALRDRADTKKLEDAKQNLLDKQKVLESDKYKEYSKLKAEQLTSEKDAAILKELNDESARLANGHIVPEMPKSEVNDEIIKGYIHYRDQIRELNRNVEQEEIVKQENAIVGEMVSKSLASKVQEILSEHPGLTFDLEPSEEERVINEALAKYNELKNIDDEYVSDIPANENIRKDIKELTLQFEYDLDDGNGRQTASIEFDVRKVMADYTRNTHIKGHYETNKLIREDFENTVKDADSSYAAKEIARKYVFQQVGNAIGATKNDVYGYPVVTHKFGNPETETKYKKQVSDFASQVEHYIYDELTTEEINDINLRDDSNSFACSTTFDVDGEKVEVKIQLDDIINKQKEVLAKEAKDREESYQKNRNDYRAQYNDMIVKQEGFEQKAVENIINKSIDEVVKNKSVTLTEEERANLFRTVATGQRGQANFETIPYSYNGLAEEVDFVAMKKTDEYYTFAQEIRTIRQHVLDALKSEEYTGSVLDTKENETDVLTKKEQLMKDALIKYAESDLGIKAKEKQNEFVAYVLGSDVTFAARMLPEMKALVDYEIIGKGKDNLSQEEILVVVDKALENVKADVTKAKEQKTEADRLWEDKYNVEKELYTSDDKKHRELMKGGALDNSVFVTNLINVMPYQDKDMQDLLVDLNVKDNKQDFSDSILKYLHQERSRDEKDLNIKPKALEEYLAEKGIMCTKEQANEILAETLLYKEEVLNQCFAQSKAYKDAAFGGKDIDAKVRTIKESLYSLVNRSEAKGIYSNEAKKLQEVINIAMGRSASDKINIDIDNNADIYDKLGDNFVYILNYAGLTLKDGKIVEMAEGNRFGTPEYYKDIILSKDKPQGYVMDEFLRPNGILNEEFNYRYSMVKKDIKSEEKEQKANEKNEIKKRKEAERKAKEEARRKAEEKKEDDSGMSM